MSKCLAILSSQNLQISAHLLYWQVSVSFFNYFDDFQICRHYHISCQYLQLTVLDSLVDPLQKTINFKPKQDAVKQEVDRNEDMIRSALRAIASLNRIRFGSKYVIIYYKWFASDFLSLPTMITLLIWGWKGLQNGLPDSPWIPRWEDSQGHFKFQMNYQYYIFFQTTNHKIQQCYLEEL